MKNILKIAATLLAATTITGCYDDFTGDAPTTTVCFSQQRPLRTVISGRDMEIFVGVSIGGKREVDMNDWATFKIDPSLITAESGLTLLPPSHYTLASPDRMTVRRDNLPVADVGVVFTDAFYNDPQSVGKHYALPLTITGSSLDEVVAGKESTVVAVKYISNYHGTYYIKGSVVEVDADGNAVGEPSVYANADLVANATRDFATRSQTEVVRPGVADIVMGSGESASVLLAVAPNGTDVAVSSGGGSLPVTGISGRYVVGDSNPEFVVSYRFERAGKSYKVEENLILRQDPLLDMRVETW